MEALIAKIVGKLRQMPISKLETALELIEIIDYQEAQSLHTPEDEGQTVEEKTLITPEEPESWQAFVNQYSGIWSDLPIEPIVEKNDLSGIGQDAPREPF